jgi:hypothetical protein
MEFVTYGITELDSNGVPREVIGFLDADAPQTAFSEADKEKVVAHLYVRRPFPKIDIHPAPLNDSNQRSHDGTPDCISENGKRIWIFRAH